MRSILAIFTLTLFFSFHTFSQEKNYRNEIAPRPTAERLLEIHEPNKNDLQGLDEKNTRTTVTKTVQDNGFLLIESFSQKWDGSVWVNMSKSSYIFDGKNNQTEWLSQTWIDSEWVNGSVLLSTYDEYNNLIEEIYKTWTGFEWNNYSKESYL